MDKQILKRTVFFLLMVFVCNFPVRAQQTGTPSNSDWQFWPDFNLSFKISETVFMFSYGTLRFGKNSSELIQEQIGGGINFSLIKHFSLATAYRYVAQQPPGGKPSREHRYFVDFTARFPLVAGIQISDRNRVELRRINGIDSGRYRNRLQFERSFKVKKYKVKPFLADEAFYDGRFNIWNRNRVYLGARVSLTKSFSIESYYLEQHDVRDKPFTRRHVIGLGFRFDY